MLLPVTALSSVCLTAVAAASSTNIRQLSQLPEGTWLENVAIRPSTGAIIATELMPEANVWILAKPTKENSTPRMKLLKTLPEGNAAIGITQIEDVNGLETFVVTGGNFTGTSIPVKGTFSAYTIQFLSKHSDKVRVKKVASLGKSSEGPNGITSSPEFPGLVFIADSSIGSVSRLDVSNGHYESGLWSDASMRHPANGTTGANGIKIRDSHLYYTNSDLVSIYRLPMTSEGYPFPKAKPQLVANMSDVASIVDDFTFDRYGNIYAATNLDNTVIYIDALSGKSKIVAGGLKDSVLEGVGALALRKENEMGTDTILYGVTSGGLERPIDGKTEGAKVSTITMNGLPLLS